MKNLLSFLAGVLIGIAGHWYFSQPKSNRTVEDAKQSVQDSAAKVERSFKESFDTDAIKDEMSRTGKVIREKARQAGDAISDAAANASTTATIKAKFIKEPSLSALKIDVDTTDGVVTLSGTVSSHEEIATAMRLAFETEGVTKVVSSLQVKP